MSKSYVITRLPLSGQSYMVFAVLDEKKKLVEITCENDTHQRILGNMYIGKVKDVVQNLNAAFIDIGNGVTCYYSMEDYKHPLFTRKLGKNLLCAGDELVVQVVKDAVKTKFPVVTTNLNFTGKYMVLTTENNRIGVSNKLTKEQKLALKEKFKAEQNEDYGIVIRTNAAAADDEELQAEYALLQQEYRQLKETCVHKTAFSLLRGTEAFYLKELQGIALTDSDEIVTDLKEVYEALEESPSHSFGGKQGKSPSHSFGGKVRFYEDNYALAKLYSLESSIQAALTEKVWLKSGAYLIITPTEALTVIDVNSGKNMAKKNPQENFLKINKEAALEIAYQLRLRNISGICIIDFINLKSKTGVDELMHTLRMALKEDPVQTNLIDITKLGLVELTRKKVKRSLREQLL